MRNKYSIKPIIRNDKMRADGKVPITIQVILNNKIFKRATGEFILPEDWDKENNIVKKSAFRAVLTNSRISREINDLEEHLNKISTYKNILSFDDIRSFYQEEEKVYLYDFWEQQIAAWTKSLRATTIKNYSCTLNRLKEFAPNPLLADINYKFIARFDTYLKTVRNNELSGANTRHKCLKTILREAKRHNLITELPYENFKLKKSEGKKVYLTSQELDKLMKCEISSEAIHLMEVRDMFVFSCFTGLRISDVTNLKWNNIQGDKLRIDMIKTGEYLVTGLINTTKEIVERYRGRGSEYVFPRRSHQKINKNLKTLAGLAKIKKVITFHVGRHTFASSLLEKEVHVYDIMKLMGHKNISITTNYLHSIDERRANVIKVLDVVN